MLAALAADPLLQTAARVSATFHLDPVAVLSTTDEFELHVRIAAARVVHDDERKANEASKRSAPRPRGRRR